MTIPLEVRISLLRRYGTFANAYAATVQPDLEHFGDERGFLSYRIVAGTAFVLADPIAPPQNHAELISRFVEEKGDVCFCAASRSTAELLASGNFFINEMGPENRLDLDTFSLSGRANENLRYAVNRIGKLGYVTRECSFASLNAGEVNAVSDAWRRTRPVHGREIAFLNRPIVLGDEPDVRKFFTFDRDENIVAFGFFDPVYQEGRAVGYYNQIKRHLPGIDPRITNAMMCHAIREFQQESRKWLFLGISPFADVKHVEDHGFKRSWWVMRCFRTAYKNPLFNRYVYPFRGLHEHKRRFHAVKEQTYYASNRSPSLIRILKMLVACRILPTVWLFGLSSTPAGLVSPPVKQYQS